MTTWRIGRLAEVSFFFQLHSLSLFILIQWYEVIFISMTVTHVMSRGCLYPTLQFLIMIVSAPAAAVVISNTAIKRGVTLYILHFTFKWDCCQKQWWRWLGLQQSAVLCSAADAILLQTILSLIYCLQLSPVQSSVQAKVAESWTHSPFTVSSAISESV